MKKIVIGLAVMASMMVLLSMTGCDSREVSSKEEAIYATQALPECEEIISYTLVTSHNFQSALFASTFRVNGSKASFKAAHIIVYKVKESEPKIYNKVNVVVWDDNRPPQQIGAE